MIIKTTLEWKYTPTDVFEAPYRFAAENFEIQIDDGVVTLTLAEPREQLDQEERLSLEAFVRTTFQALQVMTHKKIELHESKTTNYNADGTHNDFVRLEVASLSFSSTSIDFYDSRTERIQKHHSFIDSILKQAPQNGLLLLLLRSYVAAINDPANEYLYLHEIRDALRAHFGTEQKAIDALKISYGNWKHLGRLSSHDPLNESRHRGLHLGETRPSTNEELADARQVARQLIEAYVAFVNGEIEA
jgi:hypothetical protein